MSSLTQLRSRGRAYQCKRCNKIDRKGRVVSHVLKHHVPFDQVPFSCSLCSFRCQERQSLMDHIRKYSRHREEEVKLGAPDYTKILKMSANPYYIGENDITQLSREDSLRWFSRNHQSDNILDEFDGMFEDDEDEVVTSGGLSFPRWLLGASLTSPTTTQSLGTSTTTTSAVKAPVFTASTLLGYHLQTIPQAPRFENQPYSFQPLVRTTQQPPFGTFRPVISSPFPSMPCGFSTIDQTYLNSIAGHQPIPPPVTSGSSLNTPILHIPSPPQFPPTPCLDEHGSTVNILPGLINFDRNDPLFTETQQVTVTSSQPNEPPTKKARHDDPGVFSSAPATIHSSSSKTTVSSSFHGVPSVPLPTPTSTSASQTSTSTSTSGAETSSTSGSTTNTQDALASVITDAAKLIAGAIDSNTRAIRCQEKTLDKVVGELSRIERNLHQLERAQAEKLEQKPIPSTVLKENKQNTKSMKSVVTAVKSK